MTLPSSILYQPGVLSPDRCATLIQGYTHYRDKRARQNDAFWDNRGLYAADLEPGPFRANMMNLSRHIAGILTAYYGSKSPLHCDAVHIMLWEPGSHMPPHADAEHLEPGKAHDFPWRQFAALLYLNEDYDGGHIAFPSFNASIKPRAGTLVAFPGDRRHAHGVTRVERADRYTFPGFFTTSPDHIDRAWYDPQPSIVRRQLDIPHEATT